MCGGGIEYLHRTLRVVGGDEKGSLKSETVKYGRKSQGTRTRETLRWQGPAAYTKGRPVLSSERAVPCRAKPHCTRAFPRQRSCKHGDEATVLFVNPLLGTTT
jgi:hypothetical protein